MDRPAHSLRELSAIPEFGAFVMTAPWVAFAPKGSGRRVLVLPGFTAGDISTAPLRLALRTLGHRPAPWGLGINVGPDDDTVRHLLRLLERLVRANDGPIDVVGWSLGGVMARLLAIHHPDQVRQVVSLGSPIRVEDPDTNLSDRVRRIARMAGLQRGRRAHDLTHVPVPSTSIWSRQDGVVAPVACIQPVGPTAENIEVHGAHTGLGHNPTVLWAVADRLAQADGEWRPFRPPKLLRALYPSGDDAEVTERAATAGPTDPAVGPHRLVTDPMPTRQLDPRHSRLLAIETPTALGHTSTLTILDAQGAPRRLDAMLLREEVAARLDAHPMLRQSLVDVPLNLDRPWWRDHPGFDLNYHLRHIAVPDPDDPASLAELVARIHSRPLDRGRPLWELYLVSGLADGRAALLFKMHLAALASSVDGGELNAGLVGPTPELIGTPEGTSARWCPEPGPSWLDVSTRAWWNAVIDPLRTMRTVPRTLNTVPGLRAVMNPTLALLNQRAQRSIVIGEHAGITPRTPFNGRVGPHRRWATASLGLDQIAGIRNRLGVATVDVLTAACAGALRWWLLEHDALPRESLKALVPLSVSDPEAIDGIAGVVVGLGTNLHEPADRVRLVHGQIREAIERHGAMTVAEIRGIGGGTPLVGIVASRLLERTPLADRLMPPFNATITSVPGPTEPLYALGALVEEIYPILGVTDGMALHIGAMSIGDRICLSLVSDRDAITDLDALAARIPVELDVLDDVRLD